MNPEWARLEAARNRKENWKQWGPYLSERQWGTVREDYSPNGDAWSYFTHDQARSRTYRWGEDGLGGLCDERQRLCFALALWNGRDPILKERLFGLTNAEGNHGEDVKEYYYYLDSTPTHSYMRYLYKYPQGAFPYDELVSGNRSRGREDMEYELLDTGAFDEDRYFDVFVEYAKAAADDILIRITAHNRGPESATLHLLPTLWFRNTWTWNPGSPKPRLAAVAGAAGGSAIAASHAELGAYRLIGSGAPACLFTENETNAARLFGGENPVAHVKDAFHECVVGGRTAAVNPAREGTKAALHYALEVPAGGSVALRLRLHAARAELPAQPLGDAFERTFALRAAEADAFYDSISPPGLGEDERRVMRQALAGMLWTKQYYCFDLDRWLHEHGAHPLTGKSGSLRNRQWFHMVNDDIISMPDKWEYPWYAAWDLAFHTVALQLVDPDFARDQLRLMLSSTYLHPNGQIPAYEWNFGDVNPPVHAWATLFAFRSDLANGNADLAFLKDAFNKLLLNFTWWVNRKDAAGRNVFEGGFLGLDNIGVFDRSARLPTGGHLEQADGTAWVALFAQNMLEIALELARHDSSYEELALKFVEHFLWIAAAMDRVGEHQDELWDEEDGFFYDVLRLPDGSATRLKVRSLVGLLPLCATTVISEDTVQRFPRLVAKIGLFLERHPETVANITPPTRPGVAGRRLLSLVSESKLRRILTRMLDEERFLAPHGIRSLSRWHLEHPYEFQVHGETYSVKYLPAESDSGMFGGNSNWRGPIWFPINLLLIRALLQFHLYYGDDFQIECPTGSGRQMNLFQVAQEIGGRLAGIFLRDAKGERPVFGGCDRLQHDPHWRDHLLFYEYFHGDNGAGLGASHQTGWSGLVAKLIQLFGALDERDLAQAANTAPMSSTYRRE
jgi:hypothetical protein